MTPKTPQYEMAKMRAEEKRISRKESKMMDINPETTTIRLTKMESEMYENLKKSGGKRWIGTNSQETKCLNRLWKKGVVDRYDDPVDGYKQNYLWKICKSSQRRKNIIEVK